MHPSSFLPVALPPCAPTQRGNVFPDCNCNMLKHVFMISKICRWRLHNPLAVLIMEQMRRILKCTSKLFHAHFTSVIREAPANFWVLNSITRLIQWAWMPRGKKSVFFFFFFQWHVPRVSNTGSLLCFLCAFFFYLWARLSRTWNQASSYYVSHTRQTTIWQIAAYVFCENVTTRIIFCR